MSEKAEFFYTAGDIAKLAQMTSQGVNYTVQRGELRPAARTRGGITLFSRADVEQFVARRAVQAARRGAR